MKKNIVLALIVATFSASIAGLMMFFVGTKTVSTQKPGDEVTLASLFGSPEMKEIHFVTANNIIITLNSEGQGNRTNGYENYLLLDLALSAKSTENAKRVENALPLIKSSTVNLLTNMKYSDLRNISVSQLREKLLAEYKKAYEDRGMTVTFDDVLINKMVFQ